MVGRYEWVRDPFQNTPEKVSISKEVILILENILGQVAKSKGNLVTEFWAWTDDEYFALQTKKISLAITIFNILPL